jgi:hypothetical protein
MEYDDMYIEIAGLRCVRHDTSALEGWLIMHSFRRVICGGEVFPVKRGKLGIVASDPLMQKEIDFINEMSADGGCPSVGTFMNQYGTVVGVVDFEVVSETDLPGWDGTPNPVILSNPHWLENGELIPVPPDVFLSEDRHGERRRPRFSGRRNCRR